MGHKLRRVIRKNVKIGNPKSGVILITFLESLYGQRLSLWARVRTLEAEKKELQELAEKQAKFIEEMECK
jgi:hypothetical protein